jgi:acyl transferase domain-containing protein/NADPH:quinone reductase-like Zn-dependent oxidoreductase/acyl carrier protein/phospholipid N-methyltransferase
MGLRLPGASTPDELWALLCEGRDEIREIPPDRWAISKYYDPVPGKRGKSISKWGGFCSGWDSFDPAFFGISPREASVMDPQQRFLLETAWEALEDGGEVPDLVRGTPAGVFVGISSYDFALFQGTVRNLEFIDLHSPLGSAMSIAANRISYCLNLKGPSVAVDTACSSALIAVHLACRSLWDGGCSLALAGGANFALGIQTYLSFSRMGMLSPTGKCRAFDAGADGFVRGEGCGVILLKPLSKAVAAGNPIYAVIVGTAANEDGHSDGLTIPCAEAQQALIRSACDAAGVKPSSLDYVEAHGTGTPVGDPIEATAIGRAAGEGRPSERPCLIGSIKTNIGHLEAGAGAAGLIKLALVLKNRMVPPSLHFETPNPSVDFGKLKLRVVKKLEPLPEAPRTLTGGVNSFGFGGSNAHVVLQSGPAVPLDGGVQEDGAHVLVLSARSEKALRDLSSRYASYLLAEKGGLKVALRGICGTAIHHRVHFDHRMSAVGRTHRELAEGLRAFGSGESGPFLFSGQPLAGPASDPVFVFCGQGSQWAGMGRELNEREPVYRARLEQCDALIREFSGWSLLEELARGEGGASNLDRTEIAQPAICALQIALAELWTSWGVRPGAVMGHSVGELAAAHVAGMMTLRETLRIVCARGMCIARAPAGGKMLAAGIAPADAAALIHEFDGRLSLAAVNSSRSVTLSGEGKVIDLLAHRLEANGHFCRILNVSNAFHSHFMNPVEESFKKACGPLKLEAPRVPFHSTVLSGGRPDLAAGYWWENIARGVQFGPAVETLLEEGRRVFLEIGPHPVLAGYVAEAMSERSLKGHVLPSLRRDRDPHMTLLSSRGALHVLGCPMRWDGTYPPAARAVRLPAYAWQRERYWTVLEEMELAQTSPPEHPLLGFDLRSTEPVWETTVNTQLFPYLQDHRVRDLVVFPAAGYVESALGAGKAWLGSSMLMLEDVDFRKMMVLSGSDERLKYEVAYRPEDSLFSLSSRLAGSSDSKTLHSSGRLVRRPDMAEPSPPDLDSVRTRCPRRMTSLDFYRAYSAIGLPYGPLFQSVETVWSGQGEALARIRLPDALSHEASAYQVHPVLLDACFQVPLILVLDRVQSKLYLPVRIDRLKFYRKAAGAGWCHVRLAAMGGDMLSVDVLLLDEAGRVCLQVEGFRCQATALSFSGQDAIDGVLHRISWKPKPLTPPSLATCEMPLPGILKDGCRRLSRWNRLNVAERDQMARATAPGVELSVQYILCALERMGLSLRKGQSFGLEEAARKGGVDPSLHPVMGRLLRFLEEDGILRRAGGGWAVIRTPRRKDPEVLWRRLAAGLPRCFPELALLRNCGKSLTEVLRGRKTALELIFPSASMSLAEQLYQDSYSYLPGNLLAAEVLSGLMKRIPAGKKLRVLEIGAGTGGLTFHVLPRFRPDMTEYVFTDVSPLFLSRAEQKFFDYPFVQGKVLDIERDPGPQGFEPGSFDVILASDVLHATRDLRCSLKNVKQLMAPGGVLLLLELAQVHGGTALIFGLTDGWWRFRDRDVRPDQPLLPGKRWVELLLECGFTDAVGYQEGAEVGHTRRSLVVARAPRSMVETRDSPEGSRTPKKGTWLVLEDQGEIGRRMARRLEGAGCRVVRVRRGPAFRQAGGNGFRIHPGLRGDFLRMVEAVRQTRPEGLAGVLHLWNLDIPMPGSGASGRVLKEAEGAGCHSLLYLVQALGEQFPVEQWPMLCLVTRDAQVARPMEKPNPLQASSLGVGRVIANEYAGARVKLVDLGHGSAHQQAGWLYEELCAADREDEVVWRSEGRSASRIARTSLAACMPRVPGKAFRLHSLTPGSLDRFSFTSLKRSRPGPGEVEIEVIAAGLNFRDVLKALGMYPTEDDRDLLLGDECAGVVRTMGRGVTSLKKGDAVIAMAPGCLGSHIVVPATSVIRKPDEMSFEEAAACPVVFLTAYYALHHLGKMKKGETVLIHAAAGGVGLAALQLARLAGARVVATAGSEEKRDVLTAYGAHHVLDSRSLSFADEVRRLTRGRGVDLILNSLAGDALRSGMGLLAPFGRFLEIGKRDVYENTRVGLRPLRNNATVHIIDLAPMISEPPPMIRSMCEHIWRLLRAGKLNPLPYRPFPASQAAAAFRHLSQARHVGKLVISFKAGDVSPQGALPRRNFALRPDASYLITGGLSGFGFATALWMAERGARHLILASRHGVPARAMEPHIRSLRERGVRIWTVAADVGRRSDVARILKQARAELPPLRGVIHSAMVLNDASTASMTARQFSDAMDPKAHGAWNLHVLTRKLPLDFFVLYSSISALVGNPGQANYAAANQFLDALAAYRRADGLPALSVNWGRIAEVGVVAANPDLQDFLTQLGLHGLKPVTAMETLGYLLESEWLQVGVAQVDWASVAARLSPTSPRYADVAGSSGGGGPAAEEDRLDMILCAPPHQREEKIALRLRETVAKVMRIPPSKLDMERPLNEQGLDSLMAVEMLVAVQNHFKVSLPASSFLAGTTIRKTAVMLNKTMGSAQR